MQVTAQFWGGSLDGGTLELDAPAPRVIDDASGDRYLYCGTWEGVAIYRLARLAVA